MAVGMTKTSVVGNVGLCSMADNNIGYMGEEQPGEGRVGAEEESSPGESGFQTGSIGRSPPSTDGGVYGTC